MPNVLYHYGCRDNNSPLWLIPHLVHIDQGHYVNQSAAHLILASMSLQAKAARNKATKQEAKQSPEMPHHWDCHALYPSPFLMKGSPKSEGLAYNQWRGEVNDIKRRLAMTSLFVFARSPSQKDVAISGNDETKGDIRHVLRLERREMYHQITERAQFLDTAGVGC